MTADGKYKPATCYKGTRTRTRNCLSQGEDEDAADGTCTCADPALCDHMDFVRDGNSQTEYIGPGVGDGLPECCKYILKL